MHYLQSRSNKRSPLSCSAIDLDQVGEKMILRAFSVAQSRRKVDPFSGS